MSQNKYMHPRNIYKNPPNFKELAIAYPEFRKYTKQDIKGKVTLDFKDQEALRALTTTLLQKDFGLQVEIPLNRLVPTLPLRLNYLLWIEDIMQQISITKDHQVSGVDIGTGASCIYPLLAARTQKWKMLATELDPESVNYANRNVEANGLEQFITVKQVQSGSILKGVLDMDEDYDFTMCNPPFFSNEKEADSSTKSRSDSRPLPHNIKTGSIGEVVVHGGEKSFILQMIQESGELKGVVKVFSTMVGQKTSLKYLKSELDKIGVVSHTQTEFCQGHTTRWGLAWTFVPQLDLERALRAKRKKEKPPLKYTVPVIDDPALYTVNVVINNLKLLFQQIGIEYKNMKSNQHKTVLEISATKNNWSHQRRKKREQKLQENHAAQPQQENYILNIKTAEADSLDSGSTNEVSSSKRKSELDSELEMNDSKKLKSEKQAMSSEMADTSREEDKERMNSSLSIMQSDAATEKNSTNENSSQINDSAVTTTQECLGHDGVEEVHILHAIVSVFLVNPEIHIEMACLDGVGGRETIHQVMQFIKNNLKIA